MKVILVMGTSINGYIAGEHDDTDWLKDTEQFYKTVAEFGVAVMGKRTYEECVKYDLIPYKGALNIIMTHDKELLEKNLDNCLFIFSILWNKTS